MALKPSGLIPPTCDLCHVAERCRVANELTLEQEDDTGLSGWAERKPEKWHFKKFSPPLSGLGAGEGGQGPRNKGGP